MTEGHTTEDSGPTSPAEPQIRRSAWEPFTPPGLAAFAKATPGRVFLLVATTALIAAATVVWFLNTAWFPAIRAAIHELPSQGQIRNQELNTPRTSTDPLAEHRYLGFVVLQGDQRGDLNSHVVVKFRKRTVDVCSIFGCLRFPYPRGWVVEFNRTDFEPGWGAWQPFVTALVAIGTFVGVLVLCFGLGFFYSFAVWIIARVYRRDLTWRGSWRICSAGLIPGVLLFALAVWLYGFGILDVLQFFVLSVVQFVLGWICIAFAAHVLPPAAAPKSGLGNPFATVVAGRKADASTASDDHRQN
jgi:hypothetical protein